MSTRQLSARTTREQENMSHIRGAPVDSASAAARHAYRDGRSGGVLINGELVAKVSLVSPCRLGVHSARASYLCTPLYRFSLRAFFVRLPLGLDIGQEDRGEGAPCGRSGPPFGRGAAK